MAARWLRWVWLLVSLGLSAGSAGAEVVDLRSRQTAQAAGAVLSGVAPQYAAAPNPGAEGVTLRVVGIGSFDDYVGLLNYLAHVAVIKAANPIQVANDEVTLQLKMQGSTDQLIAQLALEARLAPQASVDVAAPNALHYRWVAPHG